MYYFIMFIRIFIRTVFLDLFAIFMPMYFMVIINEDSSKECGGV